MALAVFMPACATRRPIPDPRFHRIEIVSLMDEIEAISSDIALMRKEVGDLAHFLMDESVSNRHAVWRGNVYPFTEQILQLRQARDILARQRDCLRKEKEFLEETLH
jgi:hypothetical protein